MPDVLPPPLNVCRGVSFKPNQGFKVFDVVRLLKGTSGDVHFACVLGSFGKLLFVSVVSIAR